MGTPSSVTDSRPAPSPPLTEVNIPVAQFSIRLYLRSSKNALEALNNLSLTERTLLVSSAKGDQKWVRLWTSTVCRCCPGRGGFAGHGRSARLFCFLCFVLRNACFPDSSTFSPLPPALVQRPEFARPLPGDFQDFSGAVDHAADNALVEDDAQALHGSAEEGSRLL